MAVDLARVLRPRSIAVVGASPNAAKFGGKVLDYLDRHGYRGQILPINPKYPEIGGWQCYPELAAIPPDIEVDAVLISVPRQQVADVVRACGERKAAVAVVFTSGFAEAGDDGRALQDEIVEIGRKVGVRIIGPNAFGFMNFQDNVFATPSATLRYGPVAAGPIGLVSHSGGMAMGSIYARARERGIGFSFIIAPGNEADLGLCDFLEFLADDPATKVIAACIEGIDDGPRFLAAVSLARERGKPVIVLKIGRSELGKQLALSHTGHLAGENEVFDAVARQYGLICVDDYDELYLQASLMAAISDEQRRLVAERGRIGLISISGGIAAVTGDLIGLQGLEMSRFAPSTVAVLRPMLPEFQAPANPLDLGAVALTDPGVIARSIEALQRDPDVGVIVLALTIAENYDTVLQALAERDGAVPVVVLWAGLSFSGRGAEILHEAGVPYFDAPRDAVTALSRLVDHARAWLAHGPEIGRPPASSKAAGFPGQKWLTSALDNGRTVLSEWESKQLLREIGFPTPEGRLVSSEDEAIRAAGDLGYPVVLKLVSADLPHKSDIGAVALKLDCASAVSEAYRRLYAIGQGLAAARVEGMLIERMAECAVEAVVGLKVDPQFGPVIMVGSGGVLVELMKDIAFLVPPYSEADVHATLSRIRGLSALLKGFRGKPAADADALVSLLMQLGTHAAGLAAIASEVEMNPVLVGAEGRGAVVADALIRLTSPS